MVADTPAKNASELIGAVALMMRRPLAEQRRMMPPTHNTAHPRAAPLAAADMLRRQILSID